MNEKKVYTLQEKKDRLVSAIVMLNEVDELTSEIAYELADRIYELGQEEGKA